MAKRNAVAWVRVTVWEDEETPPHTVEIQEWRRGSSARLVGFLDHYGDKLDNEETDQVQACVHASVAWLLDDALALDDGRML